MPGYDYTSYTTALSTLLAVSATDPNFVAIQPSAINYAEQRMYRELDLLSTVYTDTGTLTAGSRSFTLPSSSPGQFVTVEQFAVITPVSATADNGTSNFLTPVSRDVVDQMWPSSTGSGVPTMFAMVTQTSVVLGPWPDQAYNVQVVGTKRPAALSASNTQTFLSQYLPDAFLAASMIFMSGYQRNFGAQSDDPRMAQSWEDQYQKLMTSATSEEFRKKFEGSAWTSLPPAPQAQPARN